MEFQGQEVLSLRDTLRCSTHERIKVTSSQKLRPTIEFLWTHLQEPEIFLGSQVICFCGDPAHHIKTPTCIFYKEVYKQKWHQKGLIILLEEFRKEYLQVSHQGFFALM